MTNVDDLLRITTEMLEVLNKLDKEEADRDTTIEKMTTLIEAREKIIEEVKPPYSEQEMEKGQKVVKLNEEIAEKMERLYEVVKKDMSQVKQKKAHNRSYINPYGKM